MKTFKKIIKSKVLYIGISLFIQVIILFLLMTYFSQEFMWIYYFMLFLSVIVSMFVINRESDTSSKLLWVFIIMALPFFGGILYLLFGGRKIPKALMIQDRQAYADYTAYAEQNLKTLQANETEDLTLLKMTSLAWNNGYFPVYCNMGCKYYPKGEDQFEAQMNAIRQAKEYVFIETYIIDQGTVLDEMIDLLEQKVNEGVDVRLMYDDFGCILNLPEGFDDRLRAKGIQVHPFNPIHAQLAMQMNNRDHRKTIIVDGKVAFTGGSNLADEYVNRINRFGYWKDMGIEIHGKAVEPFVIAYLQIWNYASNVNTPYYPYICDYSDVQPDPTQGYVLPFFDSPTDNLNTGKRFHQNMITLANKTFWITTPYLILEDEMLSSLKLAVENGVDVRIVIPKIPDKKTVYAVTKENEEILVRYGVKVYEYTPGFIHGKVTLVDDEQALCGTVNMDFRSYYCNYECGTWLYKTDAIKDIRADFENIFEESHLVTLEEINQTNPFVRAYRKILKVFSPLM